MKVNPTKKSRVLAKGRVISGDEILKQLKVSILNHILLVVYCIKNIHV
jgi:hypothetical protein